MRATHAICSLLAATALVVAGNARSEPLSADDLRRAAEANVGAAVALYREFLSLPNDAVHPDDIELLVSWMEQEFGSRVFLFFREFNIFSRINRCSDLLH